MRPFHSRRLTVLKYMHEAEQFGHYVLPITAVPGIEEGASTVLIIDLALLRIRRANWNRPPPKAA
jgi:hypothetical protein